ncbi:hypothetical protein BASA62_010292 [Batrachochytrium salamandrivorans]|nr:hypothetical protein BASA62_010292 [Batrachochytrium salamandrivorans]
MIGLSDLSTGHSQLLHRQLKPSLQTHHQQAQAKKELLPSLYPKNTQDEHGQQCSLGVSPMKGVLPMLPNYTILSALGRGAFSTVYKAINNVNGQTVALKLIRKGHLSVAQERSVMRETLLLGSLFHTNIVQLFDYHDSPSYLTIVTELIAGGEIFHKLVSLGSMSEHSTRFVIRQVAEGIRYLHLERGIVHRDIKLENLLYVPYDINSGIDDVSGCGIAQVKIADFGLAKVVFDTTTQTPCGTFEYSAPEILRDENYSKSVDMWALGCVLYTLLCGFPPFYGNNPRELAIKVRYGQFQFQSPWWDSISIVAKQLVCQLLEVDPARRLDIRVMVQHPWVHNAPCMQSQARLGATAAATTAAAAVAPSQAVDGDVGVVKPVFAELPVDIAPLIATAPAICTTATVISPIGSAAISTMRAMCTDAEQPDKSGLTLYLGAQALTHHCSSGNADTLVHAENHDHVRGHQQQSVLHYQQEQQRHHHQCDGDSSIQEVIFPTCTVSSYSSNMMASGPSLNQGFQTKTKSRSKSTTTMLPSSHRIYARTRGRRLLNGWDRGVDRDDDHRHGVICTTEVANNNNATDTTAAVLEGQSKGVSALLLSSSTVCVIPQLRVNMAVEEGARTVRSELIQGGREEEGGVTVISSHAPIPSLLSAHPGSDALTVVVGSHGYWPDLDGKMLSTPLPASSTFSFGSQDQPTLLQQLEDAPRTASLHDMYSRLSDHAKKEQGVQEGEEDQVYLMDDHSLLSPLPAPPHTTLEYVFDQCDIGLDMPTAPNNTPESSPNAPILGMPKHLDMLAALLKRQQDKPSCLINPSVSPTLSSIFAIPFTAPVMGTTTATITTAMDTATTTATTTTTTTTTATTAMGTTTGIEQGRAISTEPIRTPLPILTRQAANAPMQIYQEVFVMDDVQSHIPLESTSAAAMAGMNCTMGSNSIQSAGFILPTSVYPSAPRSSSCLDLSAQESWPIRSSVQVNTPPLVAPTHLYDTRLAAAVSTKLNSIKRQADVANCISPGGSVLKTNLAMTPRPPRLQRWSVGNQASPVYGMAGYSSQKPAVSLGFNLDMSGSSLLLRRRRKKSESGIRLNEVSATTHCPHPTNLPPAHTLVVAPLSYPERG